MGKTYKDKVNHVLRHMRPSDESIVVGNKKLAQKLKYSNDITSVEAKLQFTPKERAKLRELKACIFNKPLKRTFRRGPDPLKMKTKQEINRQLLKLNSY